MREPGGKLLGSAWDQRDHRELLAYDITASWAYALMAPWEALNRIRIDHFKIHIKSVKGLCDWMSVSELVK